MLAAALTVVSGLMAPAAVYLGKLVIDAIVGSAERHNSSAVTRPVLALAVATAFTAICAGLAGLAQASLSESVALEAECEFADKASRLEFGTFDDGAMHDRLARAREGVAARPQQLLVAVFSMLSALIGLAAMAALLALLTPVLMALAALSIVPVLTVQRRQVRRLYSFYTQTTREQRLRAYLTGILTDPGLSFAKEVRTFQLRSRLIGEIRDIAASLAIRRRRVIAELMGAQALCGVFSAAALAVAFLYVAYKASDGSLTPGSAVLLTGAMGGFAAQLGHLVQLAATIEQHSVFLEDYLHLMQATTPPSVGPAVGVVLPRGPLGVEFDHVCFAYPADQADYALRNVSFSVKPGELVAIVGENGAGKTTIAKLLVGLYRPDSGSIRIGGVDTRDLAEEELASRLGALFQDYPNYFLSLRENVAWGRTTRCASDAAVEKALDVVGGRRLPDLFTRGLDAPVGKLFEGGHELSGGQWQRLALARLVYRSADIWVLDEPTAALDPRAELQVCQAIRSELAERTGILISHRMSTVRIADRVVVIERGCVVETGRHSELMKERGKYFDLFVEQASTYD